MKLIYSILGSKIKNFIIPNLMIGHRLDVFLHVEPAHAHHSATHHYNHALYAKYNVEYLHNLVNKSIYSYLLHMVMNESYSSTVDLQHQTLIQLVSQYNVFVRYQLPVQEHYAMYHDVTPLVQGYMSRNATEQFHVVFKQFNAIRQCAIWTQQHEIEVQEFYDFFIRLREDTYVLRKWLLQPIEWKNLILFSDYDSFNGICDR